MSPNSWTPFRQHLATHARAALTTMLLLGLPSMAIAGGDDHPTVMSEAQIKQILEARGYSGIRLTPLEPNTLNPQPQRGQPQSATLLESETARIGWNGTASKAGRTVNVYLSGSGQVFAR
jgi:hypothetical protein